MSKGIQDLGNGLGYIYIVTPAGVILSALDNNAENARNIKLEGVKAASVASNRLGTAIVTVDAPTGVGSITSITIAATAIIDVGTPIAYTGATTDVALAQDIVNAINSYENGAGFAQHTAVRIGAAVYITSDFASENGQTPVLVNTGNFTYTVNQDVEGGSSDTESWDSAIGYNFYLDADYGATQCSGGGTAVPNFIANAVNITNYIVNIGLQGSIPKITPTLLDNAIVADRKASVTLVNMTGESSADDKLDSIILNDVAHGDILVLFSYSDIITANSGTGNLALSTSSCAINRASTLMLIFDAGSGYWYEISRSATDVPDDSVSTVKIQGDAVTTVKILDANVTTAKIALLAITTALIDDLAVTTAKINDLAVTTAKIAALAITSSKLAADAVTTVKIINDAVTTAKILDSNVTVAKVETTLKTDLLVVPISWDTNRKGDHKVVIPFPCSITQIDVYADDLIEATDDADANFKNNAGLSMGTITFTGGDTIGTGYSVTPSANNTFTAGQVLTITTTKTTAGGNGKASIKLLKA